MQSACWLPLVGAPMYYACRGSYEICLPGALVYYACVFREVFRIFRLTFFVQKNDILKIVNNVRVRNHEISFDRYVHVINLP
jgi:hypothetical protein